MPNKGFLAGELSPTQQTGQFNPVCHSPFFFIFLASFFFTVSFSTVGWDQTLLQRRGRLQKKKCRVTHKVMNWHRDDILTYIVTSSTRTQGVLFHEKLRHKTNASLWPLPYICSLTDLVQKYLRPFRQCPLQDRKNKVHEMIRAVNNVTYTLISNFLIFHLSFLFL